MFYPNFFLLTCIIFITVTSSHSDIHPEEFPADTQYSVDASKISEEHSEYERRQAIADKYLDTLQSAKEEWIDPYDMIGLSIKQLKEQLEVKTHVSETSSNPISTHKVDTGTSYLKAGTSNVKTDTSNVQADKSNVQADKSNVQGDKSNAQGDKNNVKADTSNVKADASNVKTSITAASSSSKSSNVPKEQKGSCALDSIYVTRWLKKLLYRIEKETSEESSAISFSLDSTILESLKEMSKAKLFEVSAFDDIISNLLAQAVITQKESFTWSRTYVYYSAALWRIVYGLSVSVIVYVVHRSFARRPRFTLLCSGVVISVFWHWMHLYQQKIAQHHAELASMQIPTQCKKHDLGLLDHINEYIKSFFATNDCSKYYEALLIDPFWEVSLSVAISETVAAFVFQPLSVSSRALNSFIKQLFDGLPIHLTVALIFFIFILAIMMCNYSFSIPWISRIEPQRTITGSRVEEVRQSTSSPSVTEAVRKAASSIQSAAVDSILAEGSTAQPEPSKISPSKSIQYNLGDGIIENNSAHDSQSVASRVNVKMIPEEEPAIQSAYFDANINSNSKVNVKVKKRPRKANTSTQSSETIPKSLSMDDDSEMGATYIPDKHASTMDTARDASGSNLAQSPSNNASADENDILEVSNLPESLSDSFEILPIPLDENSDEARFRNSYPGPNCDTSMDFLQEMHAGCKFCN